MNPKSYTVENRIAYVPVLRKADIINTSEYEKYLWKLIKRSNNYDLSKSIDDDNQMVAKKRYFHSVVNVNKMTRSNSTINKRTFPLKHSNRELNQQMLDLLEIDKRNCIENQFQWKTTLQKLSYPTHGRIRKHNILHYRITTDSKKHETEMSRLITEEQLKNKRNKSIESKEKRFNTNSSDIRTDGERSIHTSQKNAQGIGKRKRTKKSREGSEYDEWKKSQSSGKIESFSQGSVKDPMEFFSNQNASSLDNKNLITKGSRITGNLRNLSRSSQDSKRSLSEGSQMETKSGRIIKKVVSKDKNIPIASSFNTTLQDINKAKEIENTTLTCLKNPTNLENIVNQQEKAPKTKKSKGSKQKNVEEKTGKKSKSKGKKQKGSKEKKKTDTKPENFALKPSKIKGFKKPDDKREGLSLTASLLNRIKGPAEVEPVAIPRFDEQLIKELADPYRDSQTADEKNSLKNLYASIKNLNMDTLSDETKYKLYLYQQRKEELDKLMQGIKDNIHKSIMDRNDCEEELRGIFDVQMKSVYSANYASKFKDNFQKDESGSDEAKSARSLSSDDRDANKRYNKQMGRSTNSYGDRIVDDNANQRKAAFLKQTKGLHDWEHIKKLKDSYAIHQNDPAYDPIREHQSQLKRHLCGGFDMKERLQYYKKMQIESTENTKRLPHEWSPRKRKLFEKLKKENPNKLNQFIQKFEKINDRYETAKLYVANN